MQSTQNLKLFHAMKELMNILVNAYHALKHVKNAIREHTTDVLNVIMVIIFPMDYVNHVSTNVKFVLMEHNKDV